MDQPFSFKVVGVHNGVITVKSRACNYDVSKAYKNFSEVTFEIPDWSPLRCLYEVFVDPFFSIEESGGVEWRGLTGILLIRRSKEAIISATQLRRGDLYTFSVNLKRKSRVYIKGCGFSYDLSSDAKPLKLEFYPDLNLDQPVCVLDGVITSGLLRTDISILLSVFANDFKKLSIPEINYKNPFLKIGAESSVSLINFNSLSLFSSKALFENKPGTLRLYTASGRFIFCQVGDKDFKCFH